MSDTGYDNVSAENSEGGTKQVAADEAKGLATDVKQSGTQVASTAKEETLQVAGEAKQQAKDLFQQVRGEVSGQASAQQQRAAGGLRTLADELSGMADRSDQSGVGSDLARQVSQRVRTVADWVEAREPADLLTEVRTFAQRKPGTFLAAAAALGLLGGRLTRGLTAGQGDSQQGGQYGGVSEYGGAEYGSGSLSRTSGSEIMAPGAYGESVGTPTAAPMVTGTSHGEPISYTDGSGAGTQTGMTGVPDYPTASGGFDDELTSDQLTSGDYQESGLGASRTSEDDPR
jgi:hypothetical protein